MMHRRRVVITGIGMRSPLGSTPDEHVRALREGRSGVVAAPEWDWITDLGPRVVGRAQAANPRDYSRALRRTMGRVGLLAVPALDDAIASSGIAREIAAGEDSWLLVGSTLGALDDIDNMLHRLRDKRSVLGAPTSGALRSMAHTAAITCSMHLEFKGRLVCPSAACATGSLAIGMGYEAIQDGRAEIALAGGADEAHASTAATFDLLKAASSHFNEAPETTPRPFDAQRDGIVCAEGAAFVVLEERDAAIARGATIWAEVLGFAANSSGTAATTPDGASIARCLRAALRDAELDASAVQYVNAHATGTTVGDAAEAAAIGEVFGASILVSSTKGHTGHTMAAAGALETIVCTLMMRDGFVHPTLNLGAIADDCRTVRHVDGVQELALTHTVSTNFALGGIQTCIVLGRG